MTKLYNVHLYREMLLYFQGIEADSPQQAAEACKSRSCEDATRRPSDCDVSVRPIAYPSPGGGVVPGNGVRDGWVWSGLGSRRIGISGHGGRGGRSRLPAVRQ